MAQLIFSNGFILLFSYLVVWKKLIWFVMTGSQNRTNWSLVISCFQGIEQLKKEERRWAKKTKWMNMRAVFGHPFSLLWFSPFSTPDHGKAETYQYVVWELSTGNKAAGSKPEWEAKPSPTGQSYGIWLLTVLNVMYTVHGQLFICFLCCQMKCAKRLFCVCAE